MNGNIYIRTFFLRFFTSNEIARAGFYRCCHSEKAPLNNLKMWNMGFKGL